MPSISNIFQGLLSWHRKLQLIEVAKQLQNSSMTAINGHRRRAKPAENVRKKEKKNIRETIKLIDSNLYATKENLRHQIKREKIGIAKVFRSSRKKTAESRAEEKYSLIGAGQSTICSCRSIYLATNETAMKELLTAKGNVTH